MNGVSVLAKVQANGGAGIDTVEIARLVEGGNRLDLTSPASNSGIFKGSTFVGFEVFTAGPIPTLGASTLVFRGNGLAQTVSGYNHVGISGIVPTE